MILLKVSKVVISTAAGCLFNVEGSCMPSAIVVPMRETLSEGTIEAVLTVTCPGIMGV
jgi:hypothetical protein